MSTGVGGTYGHHVEVMISSSLFSVKLDEVGLGISTLEY